ncbi:helix-turn-helix transcriptional regulator [Mammaliicoccus sp. A-M2]|uniref:helix-turn-helix domain-containing protein n=1 Tax=Mammaliicoccus sp. A-M2 TaxID=2898662 RepID=UPI001EFB93AE|nr:helix-turn-helix transcriptional regulator [Mammaliicoccus sp. A-M2]
MNAVEVGKRIISLREEHDLGQKDLAQILSVRVSSVSNWECGRNKPNKVIINKIKKQFNYDISNESINKTDIGKRIKNIRLQHGLSMSEFGESIDNVKSGVVSNWENGKQIPNKLRLKKIAKLGNITVDELLDITNYQELYELEKERNSLLEQEIKVLKEQLILLNKKDTSTKVSK